MLRQPFDNLKLSTPSWVASFATTEQSRTVEDFFAVGFEGWQEKGFKKGMAEGKVAGMAEGRAEIALRLLEEGISIEVICRTTGLKQGEVKQLKRKKA